MISKFLLESHQVLFLEKRLTQNDVSFIISLDGNEIVNKDTTCGSSSKSVPTSEMVPK